MSSGMVMKTAALNVMIIMSPQGLWTQMSLVGR